MVSWCQRQVPPPAGGIARGPGRAKVAQYRSKCNTLCDAPRSSPPLAPHCCSPGLRVRLGVVAVRGPQDVHPVLHGLLTLFERGR